MAGGQLSSQHNARRVNKDSQKVPFREVAAEISFHTSVHYQREQTGSCGIYSYKLFPTPRKGIWCIFLFKVTPILQFASCNGFELNVHSIIMLTGSKHQLKEL